MFRNLEQLPDDNLGGVERYWYTLASNLLGFPYVGALTIAQLALVEGACWYRITPTRGTADYDQKPKAVGRHGEVYTQLLKGSLPRHTPGLADALEAMQGGRFVVLYRDLNGQVQLIGTPEQPLEWQDTYSAGSQSQRNGFTFQFSGETSRRARPYLGNWVVSDGDLVYEEVGTGGPLPGGGGGSGGSTDRIRSFIATTTVGDIAAGDEVTVVDDATGDTMEVMLTPDSPASAQLQASNPVRQRGAGTAVSLNYTITPSTLAINKVIVAGQEQKNTDGTPKLQGTVATTTAANTDTTFALVATDSSGAIVQASASVSYQSKRFWGGMMQDPFSLPDVQLSAVLRTLSQEFSSGRGQSFSLTLADQYPVVARRAALGAGSYKVNGLPNNAFAGRTFLFTNSDGYVEEFLIERGSTPDSGTFNFIVD